MLMSPADLRTSYKLIFVWAAGATTSTILYFVTCMRPAEINTHSNAIINEVPSKWTFQPPIDPMQEALVIVFAFLFQ